MARFHAATHLVLPGGIVHVPMGLVVASHAVVPLRDITTMQPAIVPIMVVFQVVGWVVLRELAH